MESILDNLENTAAEDTAETPETPAQETSAPETPAQEPAAEEAAAAPAEEKAKKSTTESFLPEKYRNDSAFAKYKTLESLCESHKNLEKLVGKKTMLKPDETSSKEDWAAFYKSLGEPDDPAEYEFKTDDKLPAIATGKERQDFFRKTCKELHISKDAAKKLWDAGLDYAHGEMNQLAEQIKANIAQADADLHQEWGDDYKVNANKAFAVFRKLMPDADPKTYPLANSPDFIRFLVKVYPAVADDTMVQQSGSVAASAAAIDQRIAAIQNDPAYRSPSPEVRKPLMSELAALMKQKSALRV